MQFRWTTPETSPAFENGQFSFEVNDITEANPALRHQDGANILFVDGHVAHIVLPKVNKALRAPLGSIVVKTWESEFLNSAGQPADLPDYKKTAEEQGYRRNPDMPLIWSRPGKLYR
jgi:prepilin-type processing-associated H-X9-DG protein